MLHEERGRRPPGPQRRVRDQPAQERQVGRDALHLGLRQRGGEPVERLLASSSVRDQLREQRVVGRADLVALLDPRVHADPGRKPEPLDSPRLREKCPRVLRVEPYLHGVSVQGTVCYLQRFALRYA